MKFNLKYLILPLSIMVCINNNCINAMENVQHNDNLLNDNGIRYDKFKQIVQSLINLDSNDLSNEQRDFIEKLAENCNNYNLNDFTKKIHKKMHEFLDWNNIFQPIVYDFIVSDYKRREWNCKKLMESFRLCYCKYKCITKTQYEKLTKKIYCHFLVNCFEDALKHEYYNEFEVYEYTTIEPLYYLVEDDSCILKDNWVILDMMLQESNIITSELIKLLCTINNVKDYTELSTDMIAEYIKQLIRDAMMAFQKINQTNDYIKRFCNYDLKRLEDKVDNVLKSKDVINKIKQKFDIELNITMLRLQQIEQLLDKTEDLSYKSELKDKYILLLKKALNYNISQFVYYEKSRTVSHDLYTEFLEKLKSDTTDLTKIDFDRYSSYTSKNYMDSSTEIIEKLTKLLIDDFVENYYNRDESNQGIMDFILNLFNNWREYICTDEKYKNITTKELLNINSYVYNILRFAVSYCFQHILCLTQYDELKYDKLKEAYNDLLSSGNLVIVRY